MHLYAIAQTVTYQLQKFSQKDGLSSNYVLSVYQDRQGFLWFGTENGLNRFDGKYFKAFRFDPEDIETLDDNWVIQIFEDQNRNLWIITQLGLNLLDRRTGKVKRMQSLEGLFEKERIQTIHEDEVGNIWVATERARFFKLIQSKTPGIGWKLELIKSKQIGIEKWDGLYPIKIFYATPHQIWFLNGDRIYLFDLTNKTIRNLSNETIEKLIAQKNGRASAFYKDDGVIIYTIQDHIFSINSKDEIPDINFARLARFNFDLVSRFFNLSYPGHIQMINGKANTIHLATTRDIGFLDFETGEFSLMRKVGQTSKNLFPNFVGSYFVDHNGNIWVGTQGSGVFLCQKAERAFTFFKHEPADSTSIAEGQVRSLFEGDDDQIWVSILNHGLNQIKLRADYSLSKQKSIVPTAANEIESDRFIKIMAGAEGTIWMASLTNGLLQVDSMGNKLKHFTFRSDDSTTLSANRLWGLAKDSMGFIWAGTWQDGLNRIDPKTNELKRFYHNPQNENSLIDDHIRYLRVSRDNILWIGTDNGLCRYDQRRKEFTHFKHDPEDSKSLSDNLVWHIFEDSDANLWIGTNTGLNLYDKVNNNFKRYFEKDGLPDNTIYGILEDNNGIIWVGTENGLARKSPPGEKRAFLSLGIEHGLGTVAFLPKAQLKSKHANRLFFGGPEGILLIQPDYLQDDSIRLKLALHKVIKSKRKSQSPEEVDYFQSFNNHRVKMGYEDQSITFILSDLNIFNNKTYTYEYQLRGFNNQWRPVDSDLRITFNNLLAGNYSLQIRAKNIENKRSMPVKLVSLKVYAPWWASLWAYLFYVFSLIGIGLAILRFQLRLQYEKQEAQNLKMLDRFKSRLYVNITHEFRTPITIISGMLNQIEKNPKRWLKKGIRMIRNNNANLLNLINQMLELDKAETGKLSVNYQLSDIIPLLESIAEEFQTIALAQKIELTFSSSVAELKMDFDREKTYRILSNILSNAVKYTPEGGKILLQIATDTHQNLILIIKDSGIGIPKEKLPFIFDRYYQAREDETGKSGSGIGLALTQELVKLLHGEIEVVSEEGKGSIFKIILPITQSASPTAKIDKQIRQPSEIDSAASRGAISEGKIVLPLALVVEDNLDLAEYIRICLENNYQILQAKNGKEGIEQALQQLPDIIVSDIMMPEKDGFELCEILKEDHRTSHIPIILLTAKSDINSRIQGLKFGADDYLAKPFNEEELLVRMENLLRIRRQLQERYHNIFNFPTSQTIALPPNQEEKFLFQIKEVFEARMIDSDFSLDELGKELNLSRSNLYRKVKALTGRSPSVYLRLLRLQKARQLLLSSDLPIKQIAYDVGFSNPSYFSRSYSEEFGETPRKTVNTRS